MNFFASTFLLVVFALAISPPLRAAKQSYRADGVTYFRPATIKTSDLKGFDKLRKDRRKLITVALDTARNNKWLKYKYGGSTPTQGGFDCSGAMFYVLRKIGCKPPRTSAQQYVWLRDTQRITHVAGRPQSLTDKAFRKLTPGDLIFWSGTYVPTDGRTVKITHVSLYLGQEKDGRHVMVGATKGRSYRGKRGDGYGVYDFRLPSKGSKSRFVGFGPPPTIKD